MGPCPPAPSIHSHSPSPLRAQSDLSHRSAGELADAERQDVQASGLPWPPSVLSKQAPPICHESCLTLPPLAFLAPLPQLPAQGAGGQQKKSRGEKDQAQDGDDGAVGIEAVSHGSDHDPGDEDDHGEGDDAAVAGELSAPGGGHQLNLTDHGDRGDHDFSLGALLRCPWLGRRWGSQDLLDGLLRHLYSGVSPS